MTLSLGARQLIATSAVAITLSIIALALRIWSRRIMNVGLVFHDWMCIAAFVLTAGEVATYMAAAVAGGVGLPILEVMKNDPEALARYFKLFVPGQLLWAASNSCVKVSILSLYTSLFPQKRFMWVCYGTMAVTGAYFIMVIVEAFAMCKPAAYNWDKTIEGGWCSPNQNTAYLGAGIVNLIIDAFIVVLPMPMLFRLQMNLQKKFSVAGMFGLGALIIIVSLLRCVWLATWDLTDITYSVTPGAIYSVMESTLGVVNASLPTIKPACQKLFGKTAFKWTNKSLGSSDASKAGVPGSHAVSGNRDTMHHHHHASQFERLDDELPLTQVKASPDPSYPSLESGSNIRVQHEWGVDNYHGGV